MKKRTIIAMACIMGLTFFCLLWMQVRYVEEVLAMRRQHFDEQVQHVLYEVTHELELAETARYLEEGSSALDGLGASVVDTVVVFKDSTVIQRTHQVTAKDGSVFQLLETTATTNLGDKYFTKRSGSSLPHRGATLREIVQKRYANQKALVDEVIYSILYTSSDRPLQDRIDFAALDQRLQAALARANIDLAYHFSVCVSNGQCIYQCADYDPAGSEVTFSETLFKNDPAEKMGTIHLHFPQLNHYIHSSVAFITPSVVFTLILLVTFTVTMFLVFRQKKLSEVKNDFINNMTHEFKTPISSISLAAQMLSDETLRKSPQMLKRLSDTIGEETKRLRFQVEKVLQLSMDDSQQANMQLVQVNANEIITGVIRTFALKVERNSGRIIPQLHAEQALVEVDEMHFTNVVFNLMDNAVKYRKPQHPLELTVRTYNEPQRLCICIQDNGIGIRKDDLKKIFEKFYRANTGNRHDVKGFGLGLAYVHKIITAFHGTVRAESDEGIGSRFIIKLPLVRTDIK